MLSDKTIMEIGIALQAQNRVLRELELAVSEIDDSLTASAQNLSSVSETTHQLRELEALMKELEADQDWIEEEDFGDFDSNQILSLYENRQQSIFQELTKLGFKDWDSFVRQCQTHVLFRGGDPLAPYEAFLTEANLKTLQAESYGAQYKWDKWDYIFVGASGILASLTDYLLVKTPTSLTTGEYAGQAGSPISEWLKSYDTTKSNDWFAQWAEHLSETCKVPYDSMNYTGADGVEGIAGMFPKSHRFQALGHDPVLGFVFGVLDIIRGTITGFSYDNLTHTHTPIPIHGCKEPFGLILNLWDLLKQSFVNLDT